MREERKKFDSVKTQLLAVEALRALRKFMSGKEVLDLLWSGGIRISPVDLSRYVTGSVLPSPQRSMEMLEFLAEANALGTVVKRALFVDERGVVNVTRIAYDSAILSLSSALAYVKLGKLGITKIVTAAVNGVPLATRIAHVLEAELCVARHEPDASIDSYIETKYFAPDPPRYVHLYLPAFALNARDRVAIVDDLLHSGRTLKALVQLVQQKGARVEAVLALVAIGSEWSRVLHEGGSKIYIALEVGETRAL